MMTVELSDIDPYEFEKLVARVWEQQGWKTEVTPSSNDRGIDIIAKKEFPYPEKSLIQVKRYSPENKVGSGEVRKYGTLYQQEDVDTVIIVSSSKFTEQAEIIADDLGVKTIDGKALKKLISKSGLGSSIKRFDRGEVEDDSSQKPKKQKQVEGDSSQKPKKPKGADSFSISDHCNKCGFVLKWNPNSRLARCTGCGNMFRYSNNRWIPKGSEPETNPQENQNSSKEQNKDSDSQSAKKGAKQSCQEKQPRHRKEFIEKILEVFRS